MRTELDALVRAWRQRAQNLFASEDGSGAAAVTYRTAARELERVAQLAPGSAGDAVQVCAECDIADCRHIRAARAVPPDCITIQEAWEAAGGNPGIKATRAALLDALKQLDQVCDEAALAVEAAGLPPAVPERHLTLSRTLDGELVMVSWQDEDHRILEVVWQKPPAAEAEIPRGTPCELQDQDHDSPTFQQWFPARFVALDLVGGEPIVQREQRMPVFATWGGVRGITRPSRAAIRAQAWETYASETTQQGAQDAD